ncbi:phage tail protein [Xenorhabdus japonica]|uniref:Phage-related protein n=1 Tax=Xenorhabdus japonica TaxID=53341 RepID=A0A1I5E3T9_9GAMM|nr:phage tail protein [Xenorhabdus japonica]SFO05993.1 Phage-related protein [Xenorhabdus japonica]
MAIEEFKWRTQIQDSPSGEFKHRIKTVEFGDGYKQVSGDGINPESQSWPYSYLGIKEEVAPIFQFIRQHTLKSFIWTTPYGEKGLYRVKADSITIIPMSGGVMKISAIFEQAYNP